MLLALAQFLDRLARLREDRNREAHRRFSPEHDHATGCKIDIAALDRRGLSLPESEQSESFDEIAALLSVGVEPLVANVGHDVSKFLERRRDPNRFGALRVLETAGRAFDDDLIVDGHIERIANHSERRVVIAGAPVAVMFRQPRAHLRGFDCAQWQ